MAIGSIGAGVQLEQVPVVVPPVQKEHVPSSLSAEECLNAARKFYDQMSRTMEASGIPTNRHIPASALVDEDGEIIRIISHNTPDTNRRIWGSPRQLWSWVRTRAASVLS